MGRVPGFLLRHTVQVAPYLGSWGAYGPEAPVRCYVDRASGGGQRGWGNGGVLMQVTIFAQLESAPAAPAGSRVTLHTGEAGYLATVTPKEAGGLPTPDHLEIAAVVGAAYGPAFGEVVTVLRREKASADRYGNARYRWTPTDVPGCEVKPAGNSEVRGDRDQRTEQLSVVVPPGTAVTALDRLRIRGLDYEIDGEPEDLTEPATGAQPGLRLLARRVAG